MRFYQIESTLSHGENIIRRYLEELEKALGEPMERVTLADFLAADFCPVFVASGGSEESFRRIFPEVRDHYIVILTSGENNSLAASMEILSFLKMNGARGEILHGSIAQVAEKLLSMRGAFHALSKLKGMKLGCIGQPSDWLIASGYEKDALKDKLNITCVQIQMDELLDEIKRCEYPQNVYTEAFRACAFSKSEVEKALHVYGAFKRLCEKYNLSGLTVRCFDLLDTACTTGCLGLSILNDEGIFGACEGDVPSLLSMAILGTVTNEKCFMCNPSFFDTESSAATFAHCTVPTGMLKDFCLNTHFESGIGVAVQGEFEQGKCTVFKCSGDLNRYFAAEGQILPQTYSPALCRTQIRVKLDSFDYFLKNPIANHHIVCRGEHKRALDEFFRLLNA